jgi:hypothetical protein
MCSRPLSRYIYSSFTWNSKTSPLMFMSAASVLREPETNFPGFYVVENRVCYKSLTLLCYARPSPVSLCVLLLYFIMSDRHAPCRLCGIRSDKRKFRTCTRMNWWIEDFPKPIMSFDASHSQLSFGLYLALQNRNRNREDVMAAASRMKDCANFGVMIECSKNPRHARHMYLSPLTSSFLIKYYTPRKKVFTKYRKQTPFACVRLE